MYNVVGDHINNVKKNLMPVRILYSDSAECIDVVLALGVFKNTNDADIVIWSETMRSCFSMSWSTCVPKRFFLWRFVISGRLNAIAFFFL